MFGACDDCGNAHGECTCDDPPEEHRQPVQKSLDLEARYRHQMVVTVRATPDVRRLLLQEVERARSVHAVVMDAGPMATPEVRAAAFDVLHRTFQVEWRERTKWSTVRIARAHGHIMEDQHTGWRQICVRQLRGLVWLMRLAKM